MTKGFLIATVAAFAITAPAQANVAESRANAEQQAQKQAKQTRGDKRVTRAKAQPRAAERRQAVRAAQPVRAKAQPVRAKAQPVRAQPVRARAQPRAAMQRQSVRAERRGLAQQVRAQKSQVQARQRVAVERSQARKQPQIRQQVERKAPPRIQARARNQANARNQERMQNRTVERRARLVEQARQQRVERQDQARRQPPGLDRRAVVHNRNAERFAAQRQLQQQRKRQIQQRQAQQFQQVLDRRGDRQDIRAHQRQLARAFKRPSRNVGDRIDLRQRQLTRDWYDDYRARRYSRLAPSTRFVYDYNYNDGYLYKVDRNTSAVAALFPLLGGAFRVAQPMPVGYDSYNVPSAYRSLYYDTPNTQYRYGDGAIYRVNPETQLIQTVVALLTGQNLGVGQMLPAGYDVYNVPYDYRQRFADRDDMWYRYNDGHIYGVDPYSRQIQSMYPVSYGGYSVGHQVPSYASYGGYTGYGSYGGYPSQVPYGYNQLYNGQPGYNYQYANGGIYQVDPTTQIISALVALVTGTNLGVGQQLPMGYDAYNVPSAYRATYFDTPDAWYRYNDGNIYQVDPHSRMIQASIPVSYGGYMVGQPIPAAYPGYTVPNQYSGLYNAAPGYDYRYSDGGIYAVNPQTQIVQSQVALLTGQTFGVGQMLPAGYDAYNLPFDYRDRYYDSPQSMYRYADGRIYQVDPTTRLIQAVIEAIV